MLTKNIAMDSMALHGLEGNWLIVNFLNTQNYNGIFKTAAGSWVDLQREDLAAWALETAWKLMMYHSITFYTITTTHKIYILHKSTLCSTHITIYHIYVKVNDAFKVAKWQNIGTTEWKKVIYNLHLRVSSLILMRPQDRDQECSSSSRDSCSTSQFCPAL